MSKRPRPLSGFPEWLPEERLIEQRLLDTVRASFESFGFSSIETRAVEPLDTLLKKGETDKEIYLLRRLQADDDGKTDKSDRGVGLHYDLTVPFARYVEQNQGQLVFPFKRYQIQKAWRGERPQEGRYREFLQADFDVVGMNSLPLAFDAEVPRILQSILRKLPIPSVVVHINNRKVLQGFYEGLGIERVDEVLRSVDKLDKFGEERVMAMLVGEHGLERTVAQRCLQLGRISTPDTGFADQVRALGVEGETLEAGLDELCQVMDALSDLPRGSVIADLRIARGFDYYTGTVYEGLMHGFEKIGSVCAGGRYDNLVGGPDAKVQLPGVGATLGMTRILGPLFGKKLLTASRSTPTCVLVAVVNEEQRSDSDAVAQALRARGICTEVSHEATKFGKQIRYAARKGIPYVWFPPTSSDEEHTVKDIRSGDQADAAAATWSPPDADLRVSVAMRND
jgi:histidyl-tRNA synthetase